MSADVEASFLLKQSATPAFPGESVKALIYRAARRVGFSPVRAKKIWYREARSILAEEMDALRRAVAAANAEAEIELRSEYLRISEGIARIEARLVSFDANTDQPGSSRNG